MFKLLATPKKKQRESEESYGEDESIKDEPSKEEANGEVDSDEEMRGVWGNIVAPERFHLCLGTTIRPKSINQRTGSN